MIIFRKIFNSLVFMGAASSGGGTNFPNKDISTNNIKNSKNTKTAPEFNSYEILSNTSDNFNNNINKAPVITATVTPNKPSVLEKLINNKSSVAAASAGLVSTGAAAYFGAKYFNDTPSLMGGSIPASLINNPVINQPAFLNIAKSDVFKNFLANSDKKYDSLLSAFNKESGTQGIGSIIAGGSEKLNSSLELLTKNSALFKDAGFLNILEKENSTGLFSLFSNKDLFSGASATYFSNNSAFLGKFKDLTDINAMKNLLANPPKGMPVSVKAFFNSVSASGDLDKMKALETVFDPANKELLASMNALFSNPKYAEFIKSPGAMEMISGRNAEYLKILSGNQAVLANLLKNPDIAALMNNSEFQALFAKNPNLELLISNDKENLLAALNDGALPEFLKGAGNKNLELALAIGAAFGAALIGALAYSLWKSEVKEVIPPALNNITPASSTGVTPATDAGAGASATADLPLSFKNPVYEDNSNSLKKIEASSVTNIDPIDSKYDQIKNQETVTNNISSNLFNNAFGEDSFGFAYETKNKTKKDSDTLVKNLFQLPQFQEMKKGLLKLGKNLSEGKIKIEAPEAQNQVPGQVPIKYIIDVLFEGRENKNILVRSARSIGIISQSLETAIIPKNFKITKENMEQILEGTGLKLNENSKTITKDEFKKEFTKVFENIMNEYLKLNNENKKFDPKIDMEEFLKEGITGALMNLDCVEKVETNKDQAPGKQ